MPFPRRLLNDGEDLALDLKPHWWFFANHIFTGVPLLVVLILIFETHGDVHKVLFLAWGVLALLWAGWLAAKYVQWSMTHFVVTTDRVLYRTGALSKKGVEIPLDRVNNINFHQTIWERMIGAGDLEIESAGRDGQSRFENVRHPDGVQQELYRQMEMHAKKRASWSVPTAAAPTAPGPSIPEQLEQLAGLRDRGVISAAEFETKKAQLLERM